MTASEQPDLAKPCLVCAHMIPAQAQKCVVCGSYQDWLRRLPFTATILSLLIALIATLSAAVPNLRNALRTSDSNIYMKLSYFDGGEFTMVAVNSGNRPGFVSEGRIHISRYRAIDLKPKDAELVLIPPGQAISIRYVPSPLTQADISEIKKADNTSLCRGEFDVTNFQSDSISKTFDFTCSLLRRYLDRVNAGRITRY